MSRTANTRTTHRWMHASVGAILMATTVLTIPAHAQDQGLESLFNQAEKANTASTADNMALKAQLEAEIDKRLQAIAGDIGKEPELIDPSTLTVEDLDRLQREAAQTASIQERRSAQYAAIREQIELLLYLQTSLNEIEQARAAQAAAAAGGVVDANGTVAPVEQLDVEALRAQWEAEKAAEAEQAAAAAAATMDAQEKASIPRLAAIKGSNGQWEAEIESVNGIMQYVTTGDALADGFVVESIDGKTVVIKSSGSGSRYSLIPSPPMSAPSGADQARDMSAANGAGTF